MSALYLVRDGTEKIWLATEHNGRLFAWVPNLNVFVRNNPLSLDFLIDREFTYEPIDVPDAAKIMADGRIGRIDGRTKRWLIDRFRDEPDKLNPTDVLGSSPHLRAGAEPTATEIATAKAELLRATPVGEWIVYKTYPPDTARQTALQMASDLRRGKVRAFADIPMQVRIQSSPQGHHVVQIARTVATERARTKPRQAKTPKAKGT